MDEPQDSAESITAAQRASWLAQAEQGDATAQFQVARIFAGEIAGFQEDVAKAVTWYFKAANQGHVEAQLKLGLQLLDGMAKAGMKANPAQGFAWLTKAAEAQNAEAQFSLGYRFALGQNIARDIGRAIYWLLLATKQDHAKAMNTLAMLARDGVGFGAPNERLAARLFNRAMVKHNDYDAAVQLGILYARGRGIERDEARAQVLFEYAITAKEDSAMYNLALVHLNRVPPDFVTVAMWATLADRHVPDNASITKLLTVLGNIATPEQLAEGEHRASQWQRPKTGLMVVKVDASVSDAAIAAKMREAEDQAGGSLGMYFVQRGEAAEEFADLVMA